MNPRRRLMPLFAGLLIGPVFGVLFLGASPAVAAVLVAGILAISLAVLALVEQPHVWWQDNGLYLTDRPRPDATKRRYR